VACALNGVSSPASECWCDLVEDQTEEWWALGSLGQQCGTGEARDAREVDHPRLGIERLIEERSGIPDEGLLDRRRQQRPVTRSERDLFYELPSALGVLALRQQAHDRADSLAIVFEDRSGSRIAGEQHEEWRFVGRHAPHEIRLFCRETERDRAAEGVSDNVGRAAPESFDERGEISDIVMHAAPTGRSVAVAVTPPVIRNYLELACEPRRKRVPTVMINPRAVNEHERCTRAHDLVTQTVPVHDFNRHDERHPFRRGRFSVVSPIARRQAVDTGPVPGRSCAGPRFIPWADDARTIDQYDAAMATPQTDMAASMVPDLRTLAPQLLVAGVLPLMGYALLRPHVSSDATALAAVMVFPIAEIAVGRRRRGRFDPIGVIALFGIGIGLAGALALHGNATLLKVRESMLTGVFGLVCLGSLLAVRPAMFYLGRSFATGGDAARRADFDEMWQLPGVGNRFRFITAVWGVSLVAEAVVRTVLAITVSTETFLVVSPALNWGVIGGLLVFSAAFRRRSQQRVMNTLDAIPIATE